MGERVALATELQTLVKVMCLCLPFTNSVITHSHFPSVSPENQILTSQVLLSVSVPYLSHLKGLPGQEVSKDHNMDFQDSVIH